MGLFDWFSFGGKGKRPAMTYSKDKQGNHFYRLTDRDLGVYQSCLAGGYSEANMITLFETIPEVFAPVDVIASRVQNGVFQLKKISTDEVVYDNKKWNQLTNRPNWRQTWESFIYAAVVYKYVCGNRYFYSYLPSTLKKKLDNITALWLLPPQYTEPKIKSNRPTVFTATSTNDVVEYYKVSIPGEPDKLSTDLVYHDAFIHFSLNSDNPLKGIGPLRSDEMPISNLMAVYQARNAIYVKRGALGFIVGKKADVDGPIPLTPDEKDSIREEMQANYGVTGGRDVVGITDVPIDFVRIAMSIEELQPFEETYASAAAIYGSLGVPRSFIPTKDGPTYTNGPADERKLYQDVIIKNGKEICQILNKVLGLDEIGCYADVSYDHVEVLQDDKKAKADVDKVRSETAITQYKEGLITKNQLLVAIGQEAVTGGDVYITDGKNPDPMAVKLGVGGLQGLKDILVTPFPPDVKKNILVIVFGMAEGDAAKLVSNETTSQNQGA
jgi:hypothetical protein